MESVTLAMKARSRGKFSNILDNAVKKVVSLAFTLTFVKAESGF